VAESGRFVRASDLRQGGSETGFFVWDGVRREAVPAPGSGGEGSSRSGSSSRSSTSRERSRAPASRRACARCFRCSANASIATITRGRGHDHRSLDGDPFSASPEALPKPRPRSFSHSGVRVSSARRPAQRAQILLAALTGNFGRAGGGWRAGGFFTPEGFAILGMQERLGLIDWVRSRTCVSQARRDRTGLLALLRARHHLARVHGGLDAVSGDPRFGDTSAPRPVREYLREALAKGWFPVHPAPGRAPQVAVSIFGNVLRHTRANTMCATPCCPS